MNEAETRAELIDPALKASGWGIVEGSSSYLDFLMLLDMGLCLSNLQSSISNLKSWARLLGDFLLTISKANYPDKLKHC